MINVALCGYGYWGPNLLRNLMRDRHFEVIGVADQQEQKRKLVAQAYPSLALFDDAFAAIDDDRVEAIVIATPVFSHYTLAKRALEKGKHVLVEKPFCASVSEAEELVALARRKGVTLMVDHTFLFNPAVRKLGEMTRSGALGVVSYYDCLRVNLGLFQPDVNVLWDLAPHDLSIIDYLFDEEPIHVQANGYCHLNPHLPDIAYVTLHFPSRMVAHLNLSWMSPVKVRRTAIGGSDKMVVWDDLDRDEPVRVYDSGISVHAEEDRAVVIPGYRIGDVHAPRLSSAEPLACVVAHFARVIQGEERSLMDGEKGLRVVRILEEAQRSLDDSLEEIGSNYITDQLPGRAAGRAG